LDFLDFSSEKADSSRFSASVVVELPELDETVIPEGEEERFDDELAS
jgi:hypothetical protein